MSGPWVVGHGHGPLAWHDMARLARRPMGYVRSPIWFAWALQPDTNFQWAVPAGTLPRNGGRHLTTHTESILYNPIQRNESMLWENEVVDWAEKRGPRETETVRTYFKF